MTELGGAHSGYYGDPGDPACMPSDASKQVDHPRCHVWVTVRITPAGVHIVHECEKPRIRHNGVLVCEICDMRFLWPAAGER